MFACALQRVARISTCGSSTPYMHHALEHHEHEHIQTAQKLTYGVQSHAHMHIDLYPDEIRVSRRIGLISEDEGHKQRIP